MRLFSSALLIAALVPLAALAQSTKQVEVTNLPAVQDVTGTVEVTNDAANPVEIVGEVEITNLPGSKRVQPIGLSASNFNGPNFGGMYTPQYNQLCQDTFGPESSADVQSTDPQLSRTSSTCGIVAQVGVRSPGFRRA
jgi:hypothetical protein